MTAAAFAEGTEVPVEKSRAEIDGLLGKHGATQRVLAMDDERGLAIVAFTLKARQYRLELPIPTKEDVWPKAGKEPQGWHTTFDSARQNAWVDKQREQRTRERWRALVLLLKGKLEIVRLGFSTVEREFLADLVLPNGERMHAALEDKIESAYQTGGMPPLLLLGAGPK